MSLFKERSVNAKKLIQLQNKINSLTKELISAKNSSSEPSVETDKFQQKIDSMQNVIKGFEDKIETLKKSLKDLKTENRGLKTSLTRLKKKLPSTED